jgi:archaeal type IV pilus assembly protein PilA
MHNEADEFALAEVLGVILVVALTVIMAAIIGAYAFGMGQGMPITRTVVLTVDSLPDGSHILTYQGGPDHSHLQSFTVNDGTEWPWSGPKIGDSKSVAAGSRHIVVTGHFQNNIDQVVLDTRIS